MLISDKKKIIFIHNPKAAGSSIRKALEQFDDRDNFYWDHEDNSVLGRVIDKAHIPLQDFTCFDDAALLHKYLVFGFVRNPYDRVFSAFRERVRQWQLPDETDFNTFIQRELNECNIRYDWNYIHFCPQYFFFYLNGKCRADFIGRFERLQRDFIQAVNLFNLQEHSDLELVNPSETNDSKPLNPVEEPIYIDRYDSKSLAIVNKLYDRDFVYFHYDKYFPDSENELTYSKNAHEEAVYKSLGYIKGAESYYASRFDLYRKMQESFSNLENENHTLKVEHEGLESEFERLKSELESLLSSRSWRMTAPLRRFKKVISKAKSKHPT